MYKSQSESYAKAGVDVTAGYESVEKIKPLVESTFRKGVLSAIGGFGGTFEPDVTGMARPVYVSGTDGVGTKLKLAFLLGKHDTVGIDCVAMCVNDIICSGAEPLFLLDYIAMGKNFPDRTAAIVAGVAEGCRQANCALIGGETAEMPGFYPEDEYDLAGFSVGVVDYEKIIDGSKIVEGDVLIALPSSGVHSNGFSLVRKVFAPLEERIGFFVEEENCTLGELLLRPTRIYVRQVLHLTRELGLNIKGISHITGGGLYENVPRMLPDGITAKVDATKFNTPIVFKIIEEAGNIPKRDMYNTFNMGVGLVMAVAAEDKDKVMAALTEIGETPLEIGKCVKGEKGVDVTW